jgi:TetR/AcrR family transcriptional regulator, cholesterol catabolism regulator
MKIETPGGNRRQKAASQYDKIIETGLKLFAEHGFEGTTVKNLSEEAGTSLGLLYHYFKNKESLLETVVAKHSYIPRLRQVAKEDLHNLPVEELFYKTALGFYNLLGDEKALTQIFQREGRSNLAVRTVWHKTLAQASSIIQEYLNEQIEKGVLIQHNPEVTARALFSIILVMRLTEEVWPSSVPPEQLISELVKNTLHGILK